MQKISHLIAWPDQSIEKSEKLSICVVGTKRVKKSLQSLYKNVAFYGRKPRVSQFHAGDSIDNCHILLFQQGSGAKVDNYVTSSEGKPVLLVGSDEGLGIKGVHLNFLVENGKVRFEINRRAISESGFKLNPQLLRYARVVDS